MCVLPQNHCLLNSETTIYTYQISVTVLFVISAPFQMARRKQIFSIGSFAEQTYQFLQHFWQIYADIIRTVSYILGKSIVKPPVKPTFTYNYLPLNVSTPAQSTIYGKQSVQMLFLTPTVRAERGRTKQCAFPSFSLTKEQLRAKFALHDETVLKSCRCLILIGESLPPKAIAVKGFNVLSLLPLHVTTLSQLQYINISAGCCPGLILRTFQDDLQQLSRRFKATTTCFWLRQGQMSIQDVSFEANAFHCMV